MSRARLLSHVATIGFITGLLLTAFLHPAHAGVGDLLLPPVTIAASAQCQEEGLGPGTAIALVQGSKVNPGFPTVPVLLVTSCHNVNPGVLHFLDTGGVERATITTSIVPPAGWGAFAVRADKGDLLACANRNVSDEHLIYTIDYNGLNIVPDGTTTPLFAAPANGIAVCDGLAWDQSTDSIYKTNKEVLPDESISITSITRFSSTGTVLATLPAPAGCGDGGLALAGGGLLLSCSGNLTIHHLDKTTGAEIVSALTPFTGPTTTDVECDPVTFASGPSALHKDALWSKAAVSNELVAIELPGGTCGFHDGPVVFAPGACLLRDESGVFVRDESNRPIQNLADVGDLDGDALLNCWEDATVWLNNPPGDGKPGIDFDGDGVRDLILCDNNNATTPGVCGSSTHKDIFVELDYMTSHLPDATARTNVVNAFAAAPVTNPAPDGPGIRVHFQLGEEVPHTNSLALEPCTGPAGPLDTDFEQLKRDRFGTPAERVQGATTIAAKRLAFHYAVFAHKLLGSNSSGCSQIGGSDLAVTLGGFASTLVGGVIHNRGTIDQQAGTLKHELGHNLGFRHGGLDNVNCKPNYLSVMSYSRQFSNIISGRRLDYSRNDEANGVIRLDEVAGLKETDGIGPGPFPAGEKTVFGGLTGLANVVSVPGGIDWNLSKSIGAGTLPGNTRDINNLTTAGCPADGFSSLVPFNDWANVHYNLRASLEFAGGADTEQTDTTAEQEEAGFASVDSDGNDTADAVQCSGSCVLDVKPGDPNNISNLVSPLQGVLPAALLSTPTFDAPLQVDPATLTLDGHPVARNKQGKVQCSTGDVNQDGLKDLNCKFDGVSFPTQGSYQVVLEGKLVPGAGGGAIRARDLVNVQR